VSNVNDGDSSSVNDGFTVAKKYVAEPLLLLGARVPISDRTPERKKLDALMSGGVTDDGSVDTIERVI
jgi:hypothetical protein